MRTYILSGAVILALFAPMLAHGAVIINEIAWMGTAVSATDEWIELYNSGTEEAPLAGWKILADDGAPSVSLSGVIPADGYYLLERTDDESVPGVAADKVYTGDLGNAGETLKLIDGAGNVVDSVAGGADWGSIGGYNATKDTPQRQRDGTWLTGAPMPKTANTAVAADPPENGTVAGTSTTKAAVKKKAVAGGYKQVVFGYAGEDVTGVAGAPIRFEGFAVSDVNVPLKAATYRWAFGDGGYSKSREPAHTYEEPGTYTIVLKVSGKYQKGQDRITATVVPAVVRIGERKAGENGFIEIANDTAIYLDLSDWTLAIRDRERSRERAFSIPEDTQIAPKTAVRFSARITGLTLDEGDAAVLRYPSGRRAAQSP